MNSIYKDKDIKHLEMVCNCKFPKEEIDRLNYLGNILIEDIKDLSEKKKLKKIEEFGKEIKDYIMKKYM